MDCYSGATDLARLVNLSHIACIALECEWYGEWVPSAANIADLMTRVEQRGMEELLRGLGKTKIDEFDLKLPPLGDSVENLNPTH